MYAALAVENDDVNIMQRLQVRVHARSATTGQPLVRDTVELVSHLWPDCLWLNEGPAVMERLKPVRLRIDHPMRWNYTQRMVWNLCLADTNDAVHPPLRAIVQQF